MVSDSSSVLQTLLARLDLSARPGPARAAAPSPPAAAPAPPAGPNVAIPDGAVSLDPHARRGSYLNVVV